MPSLFAYPLFARQNPLEEAKNTLSSWDNCMDKAYCKWPVIVAIIIGALILISVVTCIARCICCGAECACCCFRCCTSCCGSSGRGHKRVDSNPAAPYPQPYGAPAQYSAPPPMNPYAQAHAHAPPAPPTPPAPPAFDPRPVNQQYRSNAMPTLTPAAQPERPQFATFDSTRAVVNEDSLPAMPTWKDGRDVHVEVEEQPAPQKQGDMELDRLDHNGSVSSGAMGGVAAAAVPSARRSPGPGRSPISPVGDNYGYPQDKSLVDESAPLHNQGQYGQQYAQQDEYHRGPPAQNPSPVYDISAGYAQQQQQQQQPYGRRLPGQPQAYESHDQLNQYNQPAPYSNNQHDPYDQRDYYDEPDDRYQSPPPAANPYGYNASIAPSYHTYDQAQQQQQQQSQSPPSALLPGRPVQESSPVSAYPGQRSYTPVSGSVGQQQPYRAFTPGAEQQQQQQQQQYAGLSRKPVDGTYREI